MQTSASPLIGRDDKPRPYSNVLLHVALWLREAGISVMYSSCNIQARASTDIATRR